MHANSSAAERTVRCASVYLIEAQALFVPTLIDVFAEAGLELRGVSGDADARSLIDAKPDVIFVDVDFLTQEPVHLVGFLRTLLPQAAIYVYTSVTSWVMSAGFPGASAVFSKHASRQEIVAGLRGEGLSHPA